MDEAKTSSALEADRAVRERLGGYHPVTKPIHYNSHPSGVEAIQVTEHMNFCVGNAMKYLWRADLKNGLEDLEKAAWYIQREIERRKKLAPPSVAP